MDQTPARVLALDVRTRRLGFAVFEGPDRLLDFGVRLFADTSDGLEPAKAAARKAAGLVLYFRPNLVLLRGHGKRSHRSQPGARHALAAIRAELRGLRVPVSVIREGRIVRHFQSLGCANRYRMAESLAGYHPTLAWRLPPKRKPWQSEQAIFMVFDAAALAAVHFHKDSTREDAPRSTLA